MLQTVRRRVAAIGVLVAALAGAALHAQERFDLYVAAIQDGARLPSTDLMAREIVMTENGVPGRVVRLERYSVPVRVTVLIDNGSAMSAELEELPGRVPSFGTPQPDLLAPPVGGRRVSALGHYRTGLQSLLEALPGDVEVGVVAMSPTPRWLARPTTNRVNLLRSVQLLVPEPFPARFADALVEHARRIERDAEPDRAEVGETYLPVLVVLGSTGLDGSQSRQKDLQDMLETMVRRGVRTYFAMLSEHHGALAINTGAQVILAKAIQELTQGTYASLAISSRVATLLPEWGEQIAVTHRIGTNQYRVTVERPAGASGPITALGMFIDRDGYRGVVTADGRVP